MTQISSGNLTIKAITSGMKLDRVLSLLASSEIVDGVAVYGLRKAGQERPGCDYDLLVLVKDRPLGIVQVFTCIDARVADVLFIDTPTYDQIINGQRRLSTTSAEGKLMLKMSNADIVHDPSGRLVKARETLNCESWFRVPSYSGQYLTWFSQNFTLAQIRRMIQSDDPVYLTAVDMLMTSAIGATYHAYFDIRQLPWEGEKSTVRYLLDHDPDCLKLLRNCLAASTRESKLTLYQQLVTLTLFPFGEVWDNDAVALCFAIPVSNQAQVRAALDFWETLFC